MKVVLFCGGQGMRLKDLSQNLPKPLVEVGPRPIIWHIMKYYAHYGHKDFILCLGHGGQSFKKYFLSYDEFTSNDFVLSEGGKRVELLAKDIDDWRITFVDTGISSCVGERLRRVRAFLQDDPVFLANYADGLSDLPLNVYVESFLESGKIAQFLSVPAPHTFHIIEADADNYVQRIQAVGRSPVRINAGFFALRREIFDYVKPDEELVLEPFERLIAKRELLAVPYDGFWRNMDTFKDFHELESLYTKGEAPWEVWRSLK